MALPDMQIYAFEDQFEQAMQAYLLANGINDANKQRDYELNLGDGTIKALKSPRVEVKYLNGGFQTNEHYEVVPQTGQRWLDIGTGNFYLKIVTRREDKVNTHSYWRGLCRYLMQFTQASGIGNFLKYHTVEKMIEMQSTVSIEADKLHDISALTFQVWLRIKQQFFPTS